MRFCPSSSCPSALRQRYQRKLPSSDDCPKKAPSYRSTDPASIPSRSDLTMAKDKFFARIVGHVQRHFAFPASDALLLLCGVAAHHIRYRLSMFKILTQQCAKCLMFLAFKHRSTNRHRNLRCERPLPYQCPTAKPYLSDSHESENEAQ